jgi:hypothetical protein
MEAKDWQGWILGRAGERHLDRSGTCVAAVTQMRLVLDSSCICSNTLCAVDPSDPRVEAIQCPSGAPLIDLVSIKWAIGDEASEVVLLNLPRDCVV